MQKPEQTPIEKAMADALKRGRVDLIADVLPQKWIGEYRVDFLIVPKHGKKKGIIIECDGKYHEDAEVIIYDSKRQWHLEQLGYKMIRFTGKEINFCFRMGPYDDHIINQIKATIMEGVEPYPTGRIFIEFVGADGNVYLVPE